MKRLRRLASIHAARPEPISTQMIPGDACLRQAIADAIHEG
jgi:hypothetical protein